MTRANNATKFIERERERERMNSRKLIIRVRERK
jgi:hypothetical protein